MLKLVAVPHKVMSEHGHLAASAALGAAQSTRVAARLTETQADRKTPVNLRVRCAEYLLCALERWSADVLAREPETFEAAIAAGVTDASAEVRARAGADVRASAARRVRQRRRVGGARARRGRAARGARRAVPWREAVRIDHGGA
jgi:hypothetical protein